MILHSDKKHLGKPAWIGLGVTREGNTFRVERLFVAVDQRGGKRVAWWVTPDAKPEKVLIDWPGKLKAGPFGNLYAAKEGSITLMVKEAA